MLSSLHIKNCQPHKDTFIPLHSGVNVFVGDTDSGKSAIMRSLEYVIWNRHSSKALLSHWGGVISVAVNLDGRLVTRSCNKKELYKLDDLELKSFGVKVPDEIQKAFNMSDVSHQEQIDNFFLLTKTPGHVATYLNEVANLGQIDITTKAIKSDISKNKREIEHKKTDLEKKKKELEAFGYLVDFKREIEYVSILEENHINTQLEVDAISYLSKQIKAHKNKIVEIETLVEIKDDVTLTLNLYERKEELDTQLDKLEQHMEGVNTLTSEIKESEKVLELKPLVHSIFKSKDKESDLSMKLEHLTTLSDKILYIQKKIEKTKQELSKEKQIYETELHKLGKCFFCGTKLN